jgi:hypothetical protein
MSPFSWIIPLLLLLFILYYGRTSVPRIVSFFFPGSRKLYFEDQPRVPISAERLKAIQPVIEKMEALGFSQLGFMVDKPPLWAKGSRELVLASPTEKTIASIGFRGNKPSYFFYTPFSGGQVVITAYNAFRYFRSEDLVTEVVSTQDLNEMLRIHKKQVDDFITRGFSPFSSFSQESAIEATYLYYRSPVPLRQLRIAGAINLIFLLLCIAVFALAAWGLIMAIRG